LATRGLSFADFGAIRTKEKEAGFNRLLFLCFQNQLQILINFISVRF